MRNPAETYHRQVVLRLRGAHLILIHVDKTSQVGRLKLGSSVSIQAQVFFLFYRLSQQAVGYFKVFQVHFFSTKGPDIFDTECVVLTLLLLLPTDEHCQRIFNNNQTPAKHRDIFRLDKKNQAEARFEPTD